MKLNSLVIEECLEAEDFRWRYFDVHEEVSVEYGAVQVSRNMVQLNVNNTLQNNEAKLTGYRRPSTS